MCCVCAQLLQSRPTICNPIDYSPRGSSVYVIFQARIGKWISNFHSPDDLPNPRIELVSPVSPELQADSLSAKPLEKTKSRFA